MRSKRSARNARDRACRFLSALIPFDQRIAPVFLAKDGAGVQTCRKPAISGCAPPRSCRVLPPSRRDTAPWSRLLGLSVQSRSYPPSVGCPATASEPVSPGQPPGVGPLRNALRNRCAVLANILIWTATPLYPAYRAGESISGISPLTRDGRGCVGCDVRSSGKHAGGDDRGAQCLQATRRQPARAPGRRWHPDVFSIARHPVAY
jgi:hypothetical protein